MGTRSTTQIVEIQEDWDGNEVEVPIVTFYRQFDGYPTVHGNEILEFLKLVSLKHGGLVFPLPEDFDMGQRRANGAGCLAAQMIGWFKDRQTNYHYTKDGNFETPCKMGGIYITSHDDSQAFNYKIIIRGNEIEWLIINGVKIPYDEVLHFVSDDEWWETC
tara:strand:- start:2175 stop:2657 length:483 start_codon:yes stop_codon:yes gene_type:complete